MSMNDMPYPDISDDASEDEIRDRIQNWIIQNAGSLHLNEAVSPMVGELFVPFRYGYQDILRTWLMVHARSREQDNEPAMNLMEKVIEKTVTQESRTGTLLVEST
jgi:hypothetical protein